MTSSYACHKSVHISILTIFIYSNTFVSALYLIPTFNETSRLFILIKEVHRTEIMPAPSYLKVRCLIQVIDGCNSVLCHAMNSALCLGYWLEEILSQDSFVNFNSLLRLVPFLVKYLDGHNSLSPLVFFLPMKLFADEMCVTFSGSFISESPPQFLFRN